MNRWAMKELNRAATRYARSVKPGEVDIDAQRRRHEARHANAALGMDTCWRCLAAVACDAETCPTCNTEQLPF